ncbi:MAG TPA: hypothetical protein VFY17_10890, partial [Pilimelia sp.]|nr:hypothetical protein [Pilimelia sp.]
ESAVSAPDSDPDGHAPAGRTLAGLSAPRASRARRARLLAHLAGQVGGSLRRGAKGPLQWLVDTVTGVAPHLTIRDLPTLRRHHGGRTGDVLADRLIRNAQLATAGIGAAGGGVAAAEWVVLPALLTTPVLLGVETVAVVAVEVKLIGELHAVYGVTLPSKSAARGAALVQAWAGRRGFNPVLPGLGTGAVLGVAAREQLRRQLLRRFGRNMATLGPLLTGAVAGGWLNQRATQALGRQVRDDLRGRAVSPAPSPGTP